MRRANNIDFQESGHVKNMNLMTSFDDLRQSQSQKIAL